LCIVNFTLYIETQATVRYVSKTGTSTPPYTSWETAADSIQKCINICVDGDTIVVANGTYKESLVINVILTLLGSSIDSCIIDGRGLASLTINLYRPFTIENFHIIGKAYEPLTDVVAAYYDTISCKNLWVENAYNGIGASWGANIQNCLFYNLGYCISTSSAYNINKFYIVNNILLNNKSDGVGIGNGGGGVHYIYNNIMLGLVPLLFTGISLSLDNYSEVKNNLVANYRIKNYAGDIHINDAIVENNIFIQNNNNYIGNDNITILGGDKAKVKNNIIAYAKDKGIQTGSDSLFVDYNLFIGNTSNGSSSVIFGPNNLYADPMFVNEVIPTEEMNFDFHLQNLSPAIDTGEPDIRDADGSRSDIGMYGGLLGAAYDTLTIDLPPRTPYNITHLIVVDSQKVQLWWPMNNEADFSHYNVYKDSTAGFIPSSKNKLLEVDIPYYEDYYPPIPAVYYYKLTSVDNKNNESLPSEDEVITITWIDEPVMNTISDYRLYQNYPNPFNGTTVIGYSLKEEGYVKLTVYDIRGERITALENGTKQAGYHEVVLNAGDLASGIYVYRVEILGNDRIPKFSDMKKLILLK
jgi:hypothetical protein